VFDCKYWQDLTVGLTTEQPKNKKAGGATNASSSNSESLLPLAAAALTGNVLSNGCYRVHIPNKVSVDEYVSFHGCSFILLLCGDF
jgi:hypothetical protein